MVSEAVDFVVSKIDSHPKGDHALVGAPDVHAPNWPQIREGYIKQVKTRIDQFFFQLEEEMLMTLDPKVFQSRARREASEVIFGTALTEPGHGVGP
jgi:hypothetical protein